MTKMEFAVHLYAFSLDVSEALAAAKTGGIVCATIRAENGTFFVELELRDDRFADLVVSNGRERRLFRDPGHALKVVREIGITSGRFELEEWDTKAPKVPAWSRPDQAEAMKTRHRRAEQDAEFEAEVQAELDKADDPGVQWVPHGKLMDELEQRLGAIEVDAMLAALNKSRSSSPRRGSAE